MSDLKKKKLDISRIAFCTLILCVVMIILLALYANQVQDLLLKVDEKGEGKVPNLLWLLERLAIGVPVVILAVVLTALYHNKDSYVPVKSQKEQLWVSILTTLFTYGVMMVFVLIRSKSGEVPDAEIIEETQTLWDITYKWFFVQMIPLFILIAYHGIRAGTEEKELAENSEE